MKEKVIRRELFETGPLMIWYEYYTINKGYIRCSTARIIDKGWRN